MSSKRKDARWQGACNLAATLSLEFEDFSYKGWDKLLQQIEEYMNQCPEAEDILYQQWKETLRD